jgi:tetratricopeptide (TPR) repeat protein
VFAHAIVRPKPLIRPRPNRSENDGGVERFAWLAIAAVILQSRGPPGMLGGMVPRAIGVFCVAVLLALFAALAAAKNDAEARAVEDRLWTFWRSFGDDNSQRLLEVSKQAQLSFDYGGALLALEALVKAQPDFAEGWNQLAYAYFLAGSYDLSLAALDKTLALEPLHYAALAGRGIILIQQGKEAEAQAPLKRALKINPWLKERNLVGRNPVPVP